MLPDTRTHSSVPLNLSKNDKKNDFQITSVMYREFDFASSHKNGSPIKTSYYSFLGLKRFYDSVWTASLSFLQHHNT